jgi:hypothetical protein
MKKVILYTKKRESFYIEFIIKMKSTTLTKYNYNILDC